MELVTFILLLEGLGHCMIVIGRHMAYGKEPSKASNRPELILPTGRPRFIEVLVVFGNFSQSNPYSMRGEPTGTHDLTTSRHDGTVDFVQLPEVFNRNPSPVNCTEEGSSFEFRRGRSGVARQARVPRVPSGSWAARSKFKDRVAQG